MGRISKNPRYVIDITGTSPLSLGSWEEFQCFSEFGASGHNRTMEIARHVWDLHRLT